LQRRTIQIATRVVWLGLKEIPFPTFLMDTVAQTLTSRRTKHPRSKPKSSINDEEYQSRIANAEIHGEIELEPYDVDNEHWIVNTRGPENDSHISDDHFQILAAP
jgi:hypothetical protein